MRLASWRVAPVWRHASTVLHFAALAVGLWLLAHHDNSVLWLAPLLLVTLRPGQTVTFRVTAFDAQYNASTPSGPVFAERDLFVVR